MDSLNRWIQGTWVPDLGYGPIFHLLEKGWVGFIFRTSKNEDKILRGFWFMDRAYLSIKSWNPDFDEQIEFFKTTPMWAKLPAPPHGTLE